MNRLRLWLVDFRSQWGAGFALVMLVFSASVASITLVSVEQEIEIGRQANAQYRKETPELTDAATVRYVRDVTRRLSRVASGPKYPSRWNIRTAPRGAPRRASVAGASITPPASMTTP